jgi:hypothetical protein
MFLNDLALKGSSGLRHSRIRTDGLFWKCENQVLGCFGCILANWGEWRFFIRPLVLLCRYFVARRTWR